MVVSAKPLSTFEKVDEFVISTLKFMMTVQLYTKHETDKQFYTYDGHISLHCSFKHNFTTKILLKTDVMGIIKLGMT